MVLSESWDTSCVGAKDSEKKCYMKVLLDSATFFPSVEDCASSFTDETAVINHAFDWCIFYQ